MSLMQNRVIYEVLSGSHSYGLNTPESDEDYRGIFVPTKKCLMSPFTENRGQFSGPGDRVIFNLHKFMKLAADSNPNIVELLFVDSKFIVTESPASSLLTINRHQFLSAKCKHTFSGYAHAQLKRIKRHKQWLMNPVNIKPLRSSFGLDDHKAPMASSEFGALNNLIENGSNLSQSVMEVFTAEKRYKNAMQYYKQYQNWKVNRNPKRAELERKYLYDVKMATHLVRLTIMGCQILTEGDLNVNIGDNDFIWQVKNGEIKFDELVKWAEDQDKKMDYIYNNKKYVVPHSPDIKMLEKLFFNIMGTYDGDSRKILNEIRAEEGLSPL